MGLEIDVKEEIGLDEADMRAEREAHRHQPESQMSVEPWSVGLAFAR